MGRRIPQKAVLQAEAEITQAGDSVPFFGLPACSGFDMNFAWDSDEPDVAEVDMTDGKMSVREIDTEWETMHERQIGGRFLSRQRSSKTGRARLLVRKPPFLCNLDSLTRYNVLHRTQVASANSHTITEERTAMRKLRKHLDAKQWRSYTLTGAFEEYSRRSLLSYIFRRAAPTVVGKIVATKTGIYVKPFVALCMHPIGYTANSSSGCLCPSDDVIAHLLFMRADEHLFWKKANHHNVEDPLSML